MEEPPYPIDFYHLEGIAFAYMAIVGVENFELSQKILTFVVDFQQHHIKTTMKIKEQKKSSKGFLNMICSLLLATSATIPAIAQDDPSNAWPWDFPQGLKVEMTEGQNVLSPYTFYPSAVKKGEPLKKATLIFYRTTVKQAGEEKSSLEDFGSVAEMPNALVIPLPEGAKAKKGDILLTWWQSGSGLQRAIVVNDKNPDQPVACYLDLSWPDDSKDPKIAEKRKGEQLKPNSFSVLKEGEWQSGAQVAIKKGDEWIAGILIHATDDKILTIGFGSSVEAYNRSDACLIPFNEKIKKGDKVWVKWIDYYKPGYTVIKVDAEIGRIYVKSDDSDRIESKSIAEVTKSLK